MVMGDVVSRNQVFKKKPGFDSLPKKGLGGLNADGENGRMRRVQALARLEMARRRAAGGTDLLAWTMVHRRRLGPGRLFDLKRHRYLVGIYQDKAREMVVMKAGQVGVSEFAISWMLWSADKREATGLYVFPTDTHVSDFSAARLGPAIEPEVSPYLAELVVAARGRGQRGADRVGLKRVRDRFIYFRGAKVQPDGRSPQLRSIDADVLVLDELDEMDKRAPAIAKERLGHSGIAEARMISTPTYANMGVHGAYLASDQRAWHVRCSGCGRWQDLTIDDLVVEWDDLGRPVTWHKDGEGRPFVACRACGGELDRLGSGEWVAAYPGRRVNGYHVSRLFGIHKTLVALLEALDTTDESERQQAYNQALGLPYRSPSSMSLDDETLDGCRREYGMGIGEASTTMGVDVGRVLNVVIREALETGERQARFIGEVPDFGSVSQLMRLHDVERCVVDALPETRKARDFQADWPQGMVWLAYYTTQKTGSKETAAVRWDEAKGTANLDRTRTLDAMLGRFVTAARGEAGNTLPANARDLGGYYAQVKALERVLRKGADGNQVAAYVESGPDHYAHAENYCLAAEGAPRPPKPQASSQVASARGMLD
jgi:hypothetical protein